MPAMDDPLAGRLGHDFRDAALLRQALTHRSYGTPHNERLEFVGDAVLNCVVASNERAVGLWRSCGFEVVGRVPDTFRHPKLGSVDTLVMYRRL